MAVVKLMLLPVILFLHFGLLPNHVTSSPIPSPPVKIDQRQEGETNVRADLSNIVVVIVPSDGLKLVDTASMGTLIQLFANRRRTAAGTNKTPPVPSSPYKVDIEQSAIDKLHADMDSLNSIIPASKTYDDQEERAGEIPVDSASSLEEAITGNGQVAASNLEEAITGTKEQVSVSSKEDGITGKKEQVGVSSLEEAITGTKEQVSVSSKEDGITGKKEQVDVSSLGITGTKKQGTSSIVIKEAVEKVDIVGGSTLGTTKEPGVTGDVKPETVLKTTKEPEVTGDVNAVNKDSTTMSATTMEAIVTSVNSYSKNGGSESGEKMVKLQPASVTVILAPKKPEPSGDVPERTQFVEIHKQTSASVAPSKDMPSPLSLTIEDLKRPIQVPSEDMSSKSAVKILSKETSKPQQRHHNHQHQQTPKPARKPVETGEQSSPSPTVPTKTVAAKGAKPEVNSGDQERKLKMLQSGLVFCMPGQKMNEDGECVTATVRQSRRDDMERLLAALRFGVGPANRS
ncbi:uncharacterized protein LOC111053975 [Nilaparvata lugens]|uniref:uncharacterized protein LOC111053975 n=1 Tax=Nilaparvata lugens TaxID=108931 RepID=UPI00193D3C22|nr:uncharacterized protein LOC111053975 [Nilaparvata lugens]